MWPDGALPQVIVTKLKELLALKPAIEKRLKKEFAFEAREMRRTNPRLMPFDDAVTDFTLRGGKRFRALLLLAGYQIGGGKGFSIPLPAAAALETFQTWMLVHDDVIDHGETRRGGPTLHLAMARFHSENDLLGADTEFGEAMAITLGDLMESMTVRLLLSCPVPERRKVALLNEYTEMTRFTALGQLLDSYLGASPVHRVTEEEVLTVHRLKSAVYTVSAPLRMGAILAGANARLVDRLGAFGDSLGVAFQLRDDILGIGLSSEAEVGKSTNDILEGKRTLLVVKAWQHASLKEREVLEKALGNPLVSPKDLDSALEAIRDTGSLDYSEERIEKLREKAFRELEGLSAEHAGLLREIGFLLTERKK